MISPAQRGATLVELVITIVIISVAIAGVVGAFALISGRSADPLNQTRAVELAQLYMDEIITKKYDDATPQGGQPRYTGGVILARRGARIEALTTTSTTTTKSTAKRRAAHLAP